jgi:hypothetical protein
VGGVPDRPQKTFIEHSENQNQKALLFDLSPLESIGSCVRKQDSLFVAVLGAPDGKALGAVAHGIPEVVR